MALFPETLLPKRGSFNLKLYHTLILFKHFISVCVALQLTYFFSHGQALRVDDGGEFLLFELFDSVLVVSQVQLGAHQDDGRVGAVVSHLRVPLGGGRGGGRGGERMDRVRGCGMPMDSMANSVECGWAAKRIDFSLSFLVRIQIQHDVTFEELGMGNKRTQTSTNTEQFCCVNV